MRILFDHNVPRGLRQHLSGHRIDTAREMGWDEVANGVLLSQAERDGYDVLITADQNISYQQNSALTSVGVVILLSNRLRDIRLRIEDIRAALEGIQPGEVREVPIPMSDGR